LTTREFTVSAFETSWGAAGMEGEKCAVKERAIIRGEIKLAISTLRDGIFGNGLSRGFSSI
jgi:hypothetical protein